MAWLKRKKFEMSVPRKVAQWLLWKADEHSTTYNILASHNDGTEIMAQVLFYMENLVAECSIYSRIVGCVARMEENEVIQNDDMDILRQYQISPTMFNNAKEFRSAVRDILNYDNYKSMYVIAQMLDAYINAEDTKSYDKLSVILGYRNDVHSQINLL